MTLYPKYVLSFGGWTFRAPLYLFYFTSCTQTFFHGYWASQFEQTPRRDFVQKKKKNEIFWGVELSFQDVALVEHLACGLD